MTIFLRKYNNIYLQIGLRNQNNLLNDDDCTLILATWQGQPWVGSIGEYNFHHF